ncbi:MAG: protein kinase [Planctomycetota bacterium]
MSEDPADTPPGDGPAPDSRPTVPPAVDPGGETVDVPGSEEPAAGPQGWRSRLRRGLARHEDEREEDPLELLRSTRFALERVIGQGGMGIVCVAQDPTLGRRVAIKFLRPGAEDSPERLQRFRLEARAAARLRHPHVVTVHEVGEQDGRPYLVMDYVEGESLAARIAREGALPGEEAARIAREVAEALHYAHTQALLHRDLKPGNVLLAQDGTALLTDFGLVKEIAEEAESLTVSGQIMGTPAYMPPEQAQGEQERVDRRSDVYALGATLYEALLGRPPFVEARLPQLLRAVAEEEPPAPRALRPELDRDLETICLRCLEKEPEARYASAQVLADELGRYLRHEPILARRPGLSERGRKWLRRNPTLARGVGLTAGLALVVLVVGTAGFLQRVQRERDLAQEAQGRAEQERQRAEREAERAEREAKEARRQTARAEERARIARESVQLLVNEVNFELGDLPGTAIREALGRLQRSALKQLEQLQATQETIVEASSEACDAWRQIGELALSADELERAEDAWVTATSIARLLVEGFPESLAALERLERSLNGLGRVYMERVELERALAPYREALGICRRLQELDPKDPRHPRSAAGALCLIGDVCAHLGRGGEAIAAYEEALEGLRPLADEPKVQRTMTLALNRLGTEYVRVGRMQDGLAKHEEALKISRATLEASPHSLQARRDLLTALEGTCGLLRLKGELERTRSLAEEAVEVAVGLRRADPENALFTSDSADAHEALGDVLQLQGKLPEALAAYDEANAARRQLARDHRTAAHQLKLTSSLNQAGLVAYAMGDGDRVLELCEEALKHERELLARDPRLIHVHSRLARTYGLQGDVYRDRRDMQGALEAYQASLAETEVQLEAEPGNASHLADLVINLDRVGSTLLLQGRPDEAQAEFARGVEVAESLVEKDPENTTHLDLLATAEDNVGQALEAQGDVRGALGHYTRASERLEALVAASPTHYAQRRHLAILCGRRGVVLEQLLDYDGANEALRRSVQLLHDLAEEVPTQLHLVRDYSVSLYAHARFLAARSKIRLACSAMRAAVENHEDLALKDPRLGPELEQLRRYLATLEHERQLIAGERQPETPQDYVDLARACYERQAFAQAVEAWRAALEDPEVLGDLGSGNVYNAACAAARAARAALPEARAPYVALSLEWLRRDVKLRRGALAQVESQIAEGGLPPAQLERLRTIQEQVAQSLVYARDQDTDFAELRGSPEFQALFAD